MEPELDAGRPAPLDVPAGVLELLPDAAAHILDPERRLVAANAAFRELFGFAEGEDLGASTAPLHLDEAHHERFGAVLAERASKGGRIVLDWPFRRRDGRAFVAEVSLVAAPLPRGARRGFLAIFRDVTPRRSVERQLRVHSQVLHSMSEGVSLATADGVVVYTNPAQEAMHGVAPGALIGRSLLAHSAWDAAQVERTLALIARDLAERGAWEGELAHARAEGTPFFTQARITPLDIEGAPHWVCVQEDVTERRRLEETATQHHRSLKTLVRVQEELASTLDLERVAQSATDAATVISGARFGAFFYNVVDREGARYTLYTLSGAPREAFEKFPHPRRTEVFAPTFDGTGVVRSDDITKDPRYGKNAPYRGMPSGHLPVRSYLAVPVVSRTGTVHGGIFLGHPEPGRFDAEAERLVGAIAAQAAVALDNAHLYRRALDSEARWRSVVDNAPVQIVVVDEAARVVAVNRTLGDRTAEQLLGKEIALFVVPEERERVQETLLAAIAAGEPADFETRSVVREGDTRWLHVRVAPLEREGRKGAILLSMDVTRRKRDEDEIALMRAQLIQGEKLAALGSLVSGVAHELRTPLTFLSNNAFLLQQRLARGAQKGASAREVLDEAGRFLAEIASAVDRINQLVEDLRRYTKARQDPELAEAPLGAMIADAVELFRATNRSRHPIETSLAPTRPVKGNKGALQQLVLNLLQNGADASPPGRPLRVATRDSAEGVVLEVSDQGSGIPRDIVDRMYEPLFTTKEDGTGLGLSIVRRIVEEHGAKLECDTAPGRGTRFRVTFP